MMINTRARFAVFLLVVGSLAGPTWPQSTLGAPTLPSQDTQAAWNAYAKGLQDLAQQGVSTFGRPFQALAEAKRWKSLLPLAKAWAPLSADSSQRYYDPSGFFDNPVSLALAAGQDDVVRALVNFDSSLAVRYDLTPNGWNAEPVAIAVRANSQRWVQYFLDHGADINTSYVSKVRGEAPLEPSSLLQISPSAEMDEFLIAKGIHTVWRFDEVQEGRTNDGGVRVRAEASSKSTVVTTLKKGTSLKVTGASYRYETIGGVRSFWLNVRVGGQDGWIFRPFVDCPLFDSP